MDRKQYESLSIEDRAKVVKEKYSCEATDPYVTSRDFNLRELEIDFIINNVSEGHILDLGCGNGYTDLRIAETMAAKVTGIDFSETMIEGCYYLANQYTYKLLGAVDFVLGDIRNLPQFSNGRFDYVISERGLLNLPSRECQFKTIKEAHRVLRPGGKYIMVEGTLDGLARLNALRVKFGLEPVEDKSADHVWSRKFDERELKDFLEPYFRMVYRKYFSMYCFISKVIHPLLIAPESPKFEAKINNIAKRMALAFPYSEDLGNIGQICGWVLEKK